MWIDLIDIIKLKEKKTAMGDRARTAKALNALYGSICNCQVAFNRCKDHSSDWDFVNLVYAVDSFMFSLQNLNPYLKLFEPGLEKDLKDYFLGEERRSLITDPHRLIKSQLSLLRRVVHKEMDNMQQPLDEFGSFNQAVEELAIFLLNTYEPKEIFYG